MDRPRTPGVTSAVVVGVDWGATTGIAVLTLATGEILWTGEVVCPKPHPARRGKAATKKSPAVEPVPALDRSGAWGAYGLNLAIWLATILESGDFVSLEDPGGHMTRDQWLSYGRCLAACERSAYLCRAKLVNPNTSTVKLKATGHGRAEKEEMAAAAARRWPGAGPWSEHVTDALWIAETARRGEE
jgi:hypothetical protein